jgi:parallel beta-helix repeat protein
MKIRIPMLIALALLMLSTLNAQLSIAFGQGALTPPGSPAATMKSLDQIEPRTPVDAIHAPGNDAAQFVISQPGSYYLTTNIVGGLVSLTGIEVTTNDITLDLNGFSVLGSSSTFSGIVIGGGTNITVRNGTISGWPDFGILCVGSDATFERLTLTGNQYGIFCANNNVIRDCMVAGSGVDGITVRNDCVVSGCLSLDNQGNGIVLDSGASGCLVSGNTVAGNDAGKTANIGGISVVGSNNRIEGNHVTGTSLPGNGILITNNPAYANNIVIDNSVVGGGTSNYSINASLNDVGPIGAAATNSSPWGNFSH